jgi:hypothetical protein
MVFMGPTKVKVKEVPSAAGGNANLMEFPVQQERMLRG